MSIAAVTAPGTTPGTAPRTGWVMAPGTPAGGTGDAAEWVTVTAAMTRAGVSRRTIRRWCSTQIVESRLVEEDGRQVRLIRGDTLPSSTGDGRGDGRGDVLDDGRDEVTRDTRHHVLDDDTGDGRGDADTGPGRGDTGSVLREMVTHQAQEIAFLRAQVERHTEASAEMRRLLLISQQALAATIERPALPAAPTTPETPRRVCWYWPFGRRR